MPFPFAAQLGKNDSVHVDSEFDFQPLFTVSNSIMSAANLRLTVGIVEASVAVKGDWFAVDGGQSFPGTVDFARSE